MIPCQALLADKAFATNGLLQEFDERGAIVVIAPKASRNVLRDYDWRIYRCGIWSKTPL